MQPETNPIKGDTSIRKAIGECNERTGEEKDTAPARPTEPVFVDLIWSPVIDYQPGGPVRQPYLTYRAARLKRPAESIPWNRLLAP